MRSQNSIFLFFLFLTLIVPAFLPAQWAPIPSGTSQTLHDVYLLNPDYGVAVGDTSTVLVTTDGGDSWLPVASGFKENFQSALALDEDSLLIAGGNYFDGAIYRTPDGGFKWNFVGEGIDLASNGNLIFALDNETIYKSFNRGAGWKPSVIIIGSTIILDKLIFPADSIGFCFGNISGFATLSAFGYRTDDAGDTWSALFEVDFPNANAYSAAAFPHPDTGFVFTNAYENFQPGALNQLVRVSDFVYDDSDFSDNWRFSSEIVNEDMPGLIRDAYFLDTQVGYAVSENGNIYKTFNGGRDWMVDYEGDTPLNALFVIEEETAIAVGDKGVILKLTDRPTPVREPAFAGELHIYPNPAGEWLTIEMDRPRTGSLRFYDPAGKMVREEILKRQHTLSLRLLPAGLYVVEIKTEEGLLRRKVIVQKKTD